jgi:transposase
MLGDEKKLDPRGLFHYFNLEELIPPDHILRRIDAVLDTSWVRDEVAELYADRGRPSWDPEVILRMILLGFLYDLSEHRLVEDVRMHMGYRWFCRLQPSDAVPDRTTLVKIRNEKWKSDIWWKLLSYTVQQCKEAGLISGKHVSIDGTKIKANAAWGSLAPIEPPRSLQDYLLEKAGWERWVPEEPDAEKDDDDDDEPTPRGGVDFRGKELSNDEYQSTTDPDARIYRKDDGEGAGLAYIGNICIDTKSRVVLAGEASQGRTSGEWTAGANLLDDVKQVLGHYPKIATADKGYGQKTFYAETESRGITPHIPPQGKKEIKRVPNSWVLAKPVVDIKRGGKLAKRNRGIRGRNRAVKEMDTYGYGVSRRLRLRVEQKFGEAKQCHGLRRARFRGLGKVDMQVKITAAVMNLKLLARALKGRGQTMAGAVRGCSIPDSRWGIYEYCVRAIGIVFAVLTAKTPNPGRPTFSPGF